MNKQKVIYFRTSTCISNETPSGIQNLLDIGYVVTNMASDGQGGFLVIMEDSKF